MDILYFFLDYIKINVENNFIITFFIFFLFLLIYVTFAIPGNIVFVASTGYFFGIYFGFILSILSLVFGSLIFFIFISFILKYLFPKIYEKYSDKANNYISKSSLEYLIIFRMIPGPPLMFQNLIMSILDIPKLKFIVSTFLGFSPLTFVAVFVGHQIKGVQNIKNISLNSIFSFEFFIFISVIIIILIIRIFFKR